MKKSFILFTILTPLLFAVFFGVVGYIMSYKNDVSQKIIVVDSGNLLNKSLKDENNLYFSFSNDDLETTKTNFDSKKYAGILYVPEIKEIQSKKHTIYFYADERLGLESTSIVENKIEDKIRDYKIEKLQLDKKQLESLDTKVALEPESIHPKEGKSEATSMTDKVGAGLGTFLGILLYMTILLYGSNVMRSVMEEKTNRVVEVIISSVKPTQLMLGKVIGVGMVGLTQFIIWGILMFVIQLAVQAFFGIDLQQYRQPNMATNVDPELMSSTMQQMVDEIFKINWWFVIPMFIFYFLSGYLLYASLFAAVGSAIGDDIGESQSLSMPLTIPIMMAFYIMFVSIRVPNSQLAVWSSIFPLFAPIVMPARLAFNPPMWQIVLSVVVMIASTYFFVWLAGRIFRVGILMYGKKVTLRELGKWMFYKD
jgi:ABC-2 type transport system permease protein